MEMKCIVEIKAAKESQKCYEYQTELIIPDELKNTEMLCEDIQKVVNELRIFDELLSGKIIL